LPPNGVYAVAVEGRAADDPYRPLARGVTNIGVRPTIGVRSATERPRCSVETHLLDFDGDLYGHRLKLGFVSRIRDEQKFASLDELKAQIARDVVRARAVMP
jgi:riboflavin kinase/FMN adenylyltransferase